MSIEQPSADADLRARIARRTQRTDDAERRVAALAGALAEYGLGERPAAEPAGAPDVENVVPLVLDHFHRNRPAPNSFPSMALRVIDLVERKDVDLNKLIQLIGLDPAISAAVMRVANSAIFRRGDGAHTLRAAVTQLGVREVACLASGVAARSLFEIDARAEFEMFSSCWGQLYQRAMTSAFAASWLAMEINVGRSDVAFLGGMFHDIGKSLALRSLSALAMSGTLPPLAETIVNETLERVHVEIGCALHEGWSLPEPLPTICKLHHEDRVAGGAGSGELHIVRIVSGLVELKESPAVDPVLLDQVVDSIDVLSVDPFQLRALHTRIGEFRERVAAMGELSRKKR